MVDYLSRYPELALLPSTKTGAVIERLKSIFARHGIPETVGQIMGHSLPLQILLSLPMGKALVTLRLALGTLRLMGK